MMRRLLPALLVLCSLALVGCGFLDEDIHLSDGELGMSGESIGGIGISGIGTSGGCGCGIYGRAHRRSMHYRGYPGLMSELYLDDTYIFGRSPGEDALASADTERRPGQKALPETPVESVASHAENSRREALREFAR